MSDSQSKILAEKWEPVLNLPELPKINDDHRRSVTATMLENTKKALEEGSAWSPSSLLMEAPNVAGDGTGNVKTYDPVLVLPALSSRCAHSTQTAPQWKAKLCSTKPIPLRVAIARVRKVVLLVLVQLHVVLLA
jgi:hypothetical protein